MKSIRIDLIKSKLKIIDENIDLVKENLPEKLENFIELGLIKDGIYKRNEASIQEILSICAIINSDLKLGIPSNSDDILNSLVKKKVISAKLNKKVKELKGFRNFLVHRYGKIQDNLAFENIRKDISDFKFFRDEIIKFLDTNTKKNQN